MAAEIMQEIKEKITDLILQKGSICIKDCQNLFGFGRARIVPILEYLDSTGVTRRTGDVRVLASRTG
jgi:hypothetical protein